MPHACLVLMLCVIFDSQTPAETTTGSLVVAPPAALRAGEMAEFRASPDVAAEQVRFVVRQRGAQAVIPSRRDDVGKSVWRITPAHSTTLIVALTVEPPADADATQPLRYEKLFFRVQPRKDAAGPAVPSGSPSATARFGQRFEISPLVDPTCLRVGCDLPVRVKFEGSDLKDAPLSVICTPAERQPAKDAGREGQAALPATEKPVVMRTDASGFVNIRIHAAGAWTISIEHSEPKSGDTKSVRRATAIMRFSVEDQTNADGRTPADHEPKGGK